MLDDNQVMCHKCGIVWVVAPKKKKTADLCVSCRAKPAKTVKYGGESCIPHHGKFDALDRPVLDGILFMPGERSCGHSDCVNEQHVVGVV